MDIWTALGMGLDILRCLAAVINTCIAVKSYLDNQKDNHPRQR